MRKIKSVKLAKEFNNGVQFVEKGTFLLKGGDDTTYYIKQVNTINLYFVEIDIRANKTGLFEIEYEPEGFEFKHYKTDYLIKDELNRLADWCDGQCGNDECSNVIYFNTKDNKLTIGTYPNGFNFIEIGLKFNSQQSASLFITELNKPGNSEYKEYFINLLKQTRL